ncbi:MAG: 50S ribosomal protein L9 [Actinomycetota bacterium]|jgi:large subunit ribosomal protein L9|nr:50S ribosomal protein L9 [Actinomycetota bacterium]
MKIILRADVANVGKRGDVLAVADGYARNFLVPRGLAMRASEGTAAQADSMRRSRDVKDAAARTAAEDIARRLVPAIIHISARAGSEGRLFGSVTTADVAEAVAVQTDLELDRRKMHLDEPIRELGTHRVLVKLHSEVEFPVTVEVVGS